MVGIRKEFIGQHLSIKTMSEPIIHKKIWLIKKRSNALSKRNGQTIKYQFY